ncbi:Usher syndrome type-1G protein homolog isoform X2 [Photinus pyralis]|uniref:NAD(+) ADP-ribosyltransferase n=1 Tax=Photinus pyralis TaxID=7054 RepID=A0A1Y1LI48_PHOPY|nr:Usher syndrome type-1G protein homolog isoform X2 [Photinus pyralis]
MSTDRFHKAAKDGLIEVLKETTRRDCNGRDEQGMTPTLYAAFYGHLEALRLLCGRGGDPDKADYFGNTALHLAAAQGHKAVVTFLVNFGANIYSMDIDEHTAQELAGINSREEILRYLDNVTAKLEAGDKKKSKSMKEKAKKDAEKRIKNFNKRQAKADAQAQKYQKRTLNEYTKPSMINTLRHRIKSGSMSNLSVTAQPQPAKNSFSALVSGGTLSGLKSVTGTVQRKILANKNKLANDDDFKVSEIEDGKRSVRSLTGIKRDSEVMYGGTLDNPRRGRLNDVFNDDNYLETSVKSDGGDTLTNGVLKRSVSQPDFMQQLGNSDVIQQEPASIFVRPGVGSFAFTKSITNTLQALSVNETMIEASSIGSAGSLAVRQRQFISQPFDDELSVAVFSDPESSDEENSNTPLERFLVAWGLGEYMSRFEEQKIDLDTLLLLTESDLKSLNLPLGPYRKLVTAILERKTALQNPGEVVDGQL